MAFYFYYNHPNKSVKIHRAKCGHCQDGNGRLGANIHGDMNGAWRGSFAKYEDCRTEAAGVTRDIGAILSDCKICRPNE